MRPPPSRLSRLRYRMLGLPRSPAAIDQLVLLAGGLGQVGWTASAQAKAPVNAEGEPLPWLTYGAIEWLRPRLTKSHRVFEYGVGNSTKWFAGHVGEVHGVEHHQGWVDNVRAQVPANAFVSFERASGDDVRSGEGDAYVSAIERATGLFDLVVIDGVARLDCIAPAIENLAQDGLVILDNSDRDRYRPGHEQLGAAGFGRLDFAGLVPGGVLFSCTSVFGRNLDSWSRDVAPPTPMTLDIADVSQSRDGRGRPPSGTT